jgi:two-component system, NarL family, invasion response regulator UvrY
MDSIAVLTVDDHPLIRLGVRQVLSSTTDIVIVGEASSGVEALQMLKTVAPDVIVLDLAMPGRSGVEILRRMRELDRPPPILIYSRFPEEQYAERCMHAGAAGYVMKSAAPENLIDAIRHLARGHQYLSRPVSERLQLRTSAHYPAAHKALSEREFEVLRMIVAGKSVSMIAVELSLSIKTISTHRTRILQKLHLNNTPDLVRYAIEHNIDDDTV